MKIDDDDIIFENNKKHHSIHEKADDNLIQDKGYSEDNEEHNKKKNKKNTEIKNLAVVSDKENYNIRAATIHVIGDTIQSIGVVIVAIIIYFTEEKYPYLKVIDPICTFIFAVIVMFTTYRISKDCIFILMEATPAKIDQAQFESLLLQCKGVSMIHDLHIWELSIGRIAMSCHLVSSSPKKSLHQATKVCRKFGIYHSTIQLDDEELSTKEDFVRCKQNIHQ